MNYVDKEVVVKLTLSVPEHMGVEEALKHVQEAMGRGENTLAMTEEDYEIGLSAIATDLTEGNYFDTLSEADQRNLTQGWCESMRDLITMGEAHDEAADWYRKEGEKACRRDLGEEVDEE